MSVFISYSHADSDFVDRLSLRLLNENVKVWRDEYKLSGGDSLTVRIRDAIEKASFLCVVVSDSALTSDWVKREIEAGLLRESATKGLVIVPLLLKDVPIPEALRDRLWVDFRHDIDEGMERLLNLVRRKYTDKASAGTTQDASYFIYYATEDGWVDSRYDLVIDVVSFDREESFCVLTQIRFRGNEAATQDKLTEWNIGSLKTYKEYVLRECAREFDAHPARITVRADRPARGRFFIESNDGKLRFEAHQEIKMLGANRGETTVFNFGALFRQICAASGIVIDCNGSEIE
jgi:hypothetical protein